MYEERGSLLLILEQVQALDSLIGSVCFHLLESLSHYVSIVGGPPLLTDLDRQLLALLPSTRNGIRLLLDFGQLQASTVSNHSDRDSRYLSSSGLGLLDLVLLVALPVIVIEHLDVE